MAKVQPAFPVDSIRGALGGDTNQVYYLYRGRQVSRRKGMNPQPSSRRRDWWMSQMSTWAALWAKLSYAHAEQWRAAAEYLNGLDLDDNPTLDGRQLFIRTQIFRKLANYPYTTVPPTDLSAPSYVTSIDWVQKPADAQWLRVRFRYSCGHQPSTALFVKQSPAYSHPNRRPRRWEYVTLRDPNNETPMIAYGVPPLKDVQSYFAPYPVTHGSWVYIWVQCISPGGVPSKAQIFGPIEVTLWA